MVPVEFEESMDVAQRKIRMVYRADGTKDMVRENESRSDERGGGGDDNGGEICECACLCGEKEAQWVRARVFEHKLNNTGGCEKCDRKLQVRRRPDALTQ